MSRQLIVTEDEIETARLIVDLNTTRGVETPEVIRKIAEAEAMPVGDVDSPAFESVNPDGPIFVVHGHDHATLHLAVRVLERLTDREVIVLHEQANSGQTILEKFDRHAQTAAYAVVLLTADDRGWVSGGSTQPRGRQDVITELGFFYGTLGPNRVAVLIEPGVEKPSDLRGLVYISLDASGGWEQALAKELEAAQIPVDYRRKPLT